MLAASCPLKCFGARAVSALLVALVAQACAPQGGLANDEAAGRQVAKRLQATDGASQVRSYAGDVSYPLVRAPLTLRWAEQAKLLASDGAANDTFGAHVDLHGDTAVAGARGGDDGGSNSGSAYVFERSAGMWTEQQKLRAGDATAQAGFGSTVAVQGDTIIVGASGYSSPVAGSVYVFARSAGSWSETQRLLASESSPVGYFGRGLDLDGDTIIVGSPGDDDLGSYSGAAYVFVRSAGSWTETQRLLASNGAVGAGFGGSVALSGDTALIGARGAAGAGGGTGSAYVFVRNATTWVEQQELIASGASKSDHIGQSVALSGDTALLGAPGDDPRGVNAAGAAYVFVRSAVSWVEQEMLIASDGAEVDFFGTSVAVDGDEALVGGLFSDGNVIDSGVAHAFVRTATSWAEEERLVAADSLPAKYFGCSVALNGGSAMVGAYHDDTAGLQAGAAYVMALLLVEGQPCSYAGVCAGKLCVDGFCCESLCDGPCEACNAAGLEGVCTPAPRGSVPAASCNGHLCNGGDGGCSKTCRGDAECSSDHHCQDAVACLPRVADGETCSRDEACLSGQCVDGICCAEACDGGCGSCRVAGREGVCTPYEVGYPGTPSCAPYLCAGDLSDCPSVCSGHSDCTTGHHCEDGACQADGPLGAACSDNDACAVGHCTDGLCCVADSCGAYVCGPAGVCEASCGSSAQCASGYECDSGSKCAPRDGGSGADSGGCHVASAAIATPTALSWLSGLIGLAGLGRVRRRRRRDKR